MSGRVLSFSNYLQGADNVQVIELFPSSQPTYTYDFNASISSYTFEADYQTIIIDEMSYSTADGTPNFTTSTVLGSYANATVGGANINVIDAGAGTVALTIPKNRYTGNITPDARTNVPITILSFRWTDTGVTPNTTDSHRWAIIERFEPDVTIGNPTLGTGYTVIPTA
jgi:hypothetical protein